MAKKSAVEKNQRRERLTKKHAARRAHLRVIAKDRSLPLDERLQASLKLAEMPRNGAAVRVRSRCELSGRPRAFYRKFRLSRIALRDLASIGQIPGMVKSSW